MSPQAQQTITLLIAVCSLICSIAVIILTLKRDNHNNNGEEKTKEIKTAESFKEINVKLDFQSKQLDDLAKASSESTRQFIEQGNMIAKLIEQNSALFRYKDDHESRLRVLEGKE